MGQAFPPAPNKPDHRVEVSADRERLVCRTTADRLRRRHADPRLWRDPSLLSEQAGSDMFTIDLGAALEGTGVTVTCLHPATYMDTSMVRRAGVRPLSTVEEGARAILNLATSPAVEGQTGLISTGCMRQKRRPKPMI